MIRLGNSARVMVPIRMGRFFRRRWTATKMTAAINAQASDVIEKIEPVDKNNVFNLLKRYERPSSTFTSAAAE